MKDTETVTLDEQGGDELFELCKEVYKRTGWNNQELLGGWIQDLFDGPENRGTFTTRDQIETILFKLICPLYTADYLLEKLSSDYSIEATVTYVSHNTQDALYRYMIDKLGKFVAFTLDMPMGKYPFGDKPVIPLLKLTIALSEAGELNGQSS